MKITVVGSVYFAKDLVQIYHELEQLGHQPIMHGLMFGIADGTATALIQSISKEHAKTKRKHGFIKWWHNAIKSSDAIVVCNFTKKGIENYIGGNTLMEIGFAHVNDKKVFLLNPVPTAVPYVDEIEAMVDQVLNGDLRMIE